MSTNESATATPLRPADGDELDEVLAAHDTVLVEFYTKGCALCQAMEPVLGNVAREMGAKRASRNERAGSEATHESRATDVTVAMVNPGEDIGLVDRFDIRSVPTLLLVRDGEEVARLADGFTGAGDVVTFLERHTEEAVEG
ncbi:thioredoxin family protein [Halomarina litorea]|uniref:thioredoxin family protein n=1 Tax=Halomarina litorea TaxID=2961595 RepID=UPI0020C2B3FC|nr:thioredoxin family protein [Halomarina sp. BCD28]